MKTLDILKEAWQTRDKLGDSQKSRELAAFLPAALEIQEAPPNPLTYWVSRCLLLLLVISIVWACVGEVNIVASAEGKIIPGSRVKQIQPLSKAIVKRILVREGEYVSKGQALIELDGTMTDADEKRITGELNRSQRQLGVFKAMLTLLAMSQEKQNQLDFLELDVAALAGLFSSDSALLTSTIMETSPQESKLYKRLLWQQWQKYVAQRNALKSTLIKTKAEQSAAKESVIKLSQTLPIIAKRTAVMKDLHAKGFVSEVDYLQLEQERIQQVQDLAAEKQRVKQLRAAETEVEQQINVLVAQTKAEQLGNAAEVEQQILSLNEELIKATDLNARQTLYSPVAGQVQNLAVNTVGGVVTDAQQLMRIVPTEALLEVEVTLENKDIGFVHEGMPAEIKIHTFPFTKYGVIEGEVTSVSDDATVDEKQGLIYRMQLRMADNTIWVDGKEVKLMPGMAVTAEVQTGKRRIIEFFLAPLMRYRDESIRER